MSGFENSVLFTTKSTEGLHAQFYYASDLSEEFDLFNSDGTPEGSIAADKGSMCSDTTNGAFYIKTTDTVNTGWEILSSGGTVPTQFTGDSGTATPSSNNLNIIGQDGITTSGASSTLTITPRGTGVNNIFLGENSGNLTLTGSQNTALGSTTSGALTSGTANTGMGYLALNSVTSGIENTGIGTSANGNCSTTSYNTAVGAGALDLNIGNYNTAVGRLASSANTTSEFVTSIGFNALRLATGANNTTCGADSLSNVTSGTNNTALGAFSGNAYTSTESSNILIKNTGTIADANTIRIGTQGTGAGQQDTTFIAGIVGVTNSNAQSVTVNSSTGQLGVGAAAFSGWVDEGTGITLSANSGYFVTAAVTETLPSTPSQGDVIKLICDTAGAVVITANTGQTISLGNVSSSTAGTFTSTAIGDSLELYYRAASAEWKSLNSVGNWTIA